MPLKGSGRPDQRFLFPSFRPTRRYLHFFRSQWKRSHRCSAEVTSLIVRIRVDPRAFFFPQHLVIPSVTALAVSSSDSAELPPPWSSAPRKAGLVEGAFTLSRRTTNLSGNFRPLPTSGLCALPPHLI